MRSIPRFLFLSLLTVCAFAAQTVDPLMTARNARAQIVDIIVGNKQRTASVVSQIAALETKWSLTTFDENTFGFVALPAGDNMCAITSGTSTLTSVDAPWTSADVGKTVYVQGAGTSSGTLVAVISGFNSTSSVNLSLNASTTVTPSKTSAAGIAVWGWLPSTVLEVNPLKSVDGALAYQRDVGTLTSVIATGGTTSRTIADRFADRINVKDFGAVGDGVTDDTAAIQAAIDSFTTAGGRLHFNNGTYKLSSSLNVNKPIMLFASPSGSAYQPVSSPGVKFTWSGSVGGVMVKIGGFGTCFSGGGIDGIYIDGGAIAGYCIQVKDLQRAHFRGVTLTGATIDALIFQNTIGQDPTGFMIWDDLRIQLRGGATNAATGIHVNGSNGGGAEGVTLCTFRRCRIDHANGAGIKIDDIGDYFTWESLQTFRADVETGPGVWFAATSGTAICGGHTFIHGNVSGGYRFDTAGVHSQTRVINTGQIDINSGTQVLYGAGAGEVQCESGLGFQFGRSLIPQFHSMTRYDSMALIRYDSANSVLHTSNGNWKTTVSAGGNITASGQVGSASRLSTGTTLNNITTIADIATFGSGDGVGSAYGVGFDCILSPITTTNVVLRVGFADSNNDAPTNGIYFEFDPSVNANWRCITVNGGTSTSVTTALSGGLGKIELYAFIAPTSSSVSYFYRTSGNRLFGFAGTITTNIPSAALATICRIKTKAASDAVCDIYGIKVGSADEL